MDWFLHILQHCSGGWSSIYLLFGRIVHWLGCACMYVKAKGLISSLMGNPMSELRCVTCHMGSHNVNCHPTQANTPRLNHSRWRLVLEIKHMLHLCLICCVTTVFVQHGWSVWLWATWELWCQNSWGVYVWLLDRVGSPGQTLVTLYARKKARLKVGKMYDIRCVFTICFWLECSLSLQ